MSIALEAPACALCGTTEHTLAYRCLPPYSVVRCVGCDLYYLSPRPREEEMLALYESDTYYRDGEGGYADYQAQEPALRATFRRFLRALAQRGVSGGSILEVGCGWGLLLDEARPYFDRRFGTELSAAAADRARGRADAIYRGGLESVPTGLRFDCIVANQMIEHVYAPVRFLAAMVERVRPGGHVVLATPNMGSAWRRVMGRRWPSFKVPEHVLYFDRGSLTRLLQGAGLQVVGEVPYPHAFPLPLVASKLGLRLPDALNALKVWLPQTTIALVGRWPLGPA